MPLVGDRGPAQKAAMFLRPAWAEEGLRLRGPGHACCLSSPFLVTRAPAPKPYYTARLYRFSVFSSTMMD